MAEKEVATEEEVPEKAETFEEAWDEEPEAVGGEEEAPTEKPGEPEEEAEKPKSDKPEEEEESPEKPAEEKPADEKPEIPAEDDAPAEGADEKPTYEKLEQQHKTLQGMYNKAVKEIPPEKEEEPEEETPEENFTLDIAAIAEEIEKLPGVVAAIDEHGEEMGSALKDATGLIMEKVNGVLGDMTKRVEGRFGKISEVVEPIQADHAKSKDEAHEKAIKDKHPDYRTYVDSGELREWVNTHDGIELNVLNGVMKQGTPSEAIDLIAKFREAKGYVEKKEPEEIPEEEIDESKKKKLEDMEAIDVKKTPVSLGKGKGGKDDFETSWDDF